MAKKIVAARREGLAHGYELGDNNNHRAPGWSADIAAGAGLR